ncbi:MAG TPA: hypothetical protein VFA58_04805 [Chthoniobacterales bacterium]|nr:hypothetical protein [Chthoniobacterales bacterium]
MTTCSPKLIALTLTIALLTPVIAGAGRKSAPLSEDSALNLLVDSIKRDHIYDRRISLECVTFGTVEATRIYFEFVLRENHTAKCGGDPSFTPVVDRYRVHRASGKIELYEAATDSWQPYRAQH